MGEHSPPGQRSALENARVQGKVYSGSAWMMVTRLSVKSLGLVSSIVLARLLVPEDFGLVAIAVAIYAFIELFGALGLGTVLIQRQSSDVADYNTAWTFKVVFGFLAAACLVLFAPFVASFYDEPRLRAVISVIALASVFSGASNIGVVNFQKDMNFRKELQLQLVPKVFSFIFTLTVALVYRSYWALVLGTVFSQFLVMVYSYMMHSFRPKFGLQSFHKLFSFSRWLLLNNILYFINDRASELLVGKMLSTSAVGLFSLSKEIAQLPTAEVAQPINKATFPVYSRFQDDFVELRKAYLSTVALTSALTLPAALGIAFVAPLLVEVVLGAHWLPMVPLLQLLAISSLLVSITVNNGFVYMACGRPEVMFVMNASRTVLFFLLLFPLLDTNGLLGIGQARLVTTVLMLVVVQIVMIRFLTLPFLALLSSLARPVVACSVMYGGLLLVQAFCGELGKAATLAMMVVAGAATYILVSLALWRLQGCPEGLESTVIAKLFPRNFFAQPK